MSIVHSHLGYLITLLGPKVMISHGSHILARGCRDNVRSIYQDSFLDWLELN